MLQPYASLTWFARHHPAAGRCVGFDVLPGWLSPAANTVHKILSVSSTIATKGAMVADASTLHQVGHQVAPKPNMGTKRRQPGALCRRAANHCTILCFEQPAIVGPILSLLDMAIERTGIAANVRVLQ